MANKEERLVALNMIPLTMCTARFVKLMISMVAKSLSLKFNLWQTLNLLSKSKLLLLGRCKLTRASTLSLFSKTLQIKIYLNVLTVSFQLIYGYAWLVVTSVAVEEIGMELVAIVMVCNTLKHLGIPLLLNWEQSLLKGKHLYIVTLANRMWKTNYCQIISQFWACKCQGRRKHKKLWLS